MVNPGYVVITRVYLIVAFGSIIATTGFFSLLLVTSTYFLLLRVPRFSNNDLNHVKRKYKKKNNGKRFSLYDQKSIALFVQEVVLI